MPSLLVPLALLPLSEPVLHHVIDLKDYQIHHPISFLRQRLPLALALLVLVLLALQMGRLPEPQQMVLPRLGLPNRVTVLKAHRILIQ